MRALVCMIVASATGLGACATGSAGDGGGGDGPGPECEPGTVACRDECWPICGVDERRNLATCACEPAGGDADTDADSDTDTGSGSDTDDCDDGGHECRLVGPQCGCPGGQKCTVIDAATYGCIADGPQDDGDECDNAVDDCEAGLICVGGDEMDFLCRRFCEADRDCVGDGSLCVYGLNSGGEVVPDAQMCSVDCNPLTGSGCRSGMNCNIFVTEAGGDVYLTDCDEREDPAGTQGVACDGDVGPYCARGLACVDAGDGAGWVCRDWCEPPGGFGACAGGLDCLGFDPAADVAGTEYGVCV